MKPLTAKALVHLPNPELVIAPQLRLSKLVTYASKQRLAVKVRSQKIRYSSTITTSGTPISHRRIPAIAAS
jgi:hypothetical protein